ncbi:MAG: hypothetical protein AB7Q01_08515 [Gammaproteobacteria bacterium]
MSTDFFNQKKSEMEVVLAPAFLARLTGNSMEKATGQYAKGETQWVLLWEPLTFKTKTGNPIPVYLDPTNNKNSKTYRQLEAFDKVPGVRVDSPADVSSYLGQAFFVQKHPFKFGKVETEMLVPIELVDEARVPAIIAEAEAAAKNREASSAPASSGLDPMALVAQLLEAGPATIAEFKSRFMASPYKSDPALSASVISGKILEQAVSAGVITQDGKVFSIGVPVAA